MTNTSIKRALVTGGSGVLGAAICRQRAADGYHVLVHANRRREQAQQVADSIAAAGGHAEVLVFDVTDADAVAAALQPLVEDEPIQVLVNNAGLHDAALFPGMRADQSKREIDVSLNGIFHVTPA